MPSTGLGIGVYRYALDERHADNSRWTIIDTLYFSMVTMSTVELRVTEVARAHGPKFPAGLVPWRAGKSRSGLCVRTRAP